MKLALLWIAIAVSPALLAQPDAEASEVLIIAPTPQTQEQRESTKEIIGGQIISVDPNARSRELSATTGIREITIPNSATITITGGQIVETPQNAPQQ